MSPIPAPHLGPVTLTPLALLQGRPSPFRRNTPHPTPFPTESWDTPPPLPIMLLWDTPQSLTQGGPLIPTLLRMASPVISCGRGEVSIPALSPPPRNPSPQCWGS